MEYVKLNNGVEMPLISFGVYQIPKEDTKRCVLDAIKSGYRGIDTAQSYFNESEVGDAIVECGVPREELFITTKVWIDHYGYEECKASVEESLRKLKTDYFYIRKGENGNPPCNWRSYFGGSVWERIGDTDDYYLHYFAKEQPDLN